jgi:Fe-S-cluster containining protein
MITSISALADYDNGDGTCRYLVANLCAVYPDRPQICNTSAMYDAFFKQGMSEREFVKINLESCEKIALLFNDESALRKIKEAARQWL